MRRAALSLITALGLSVAATGGYAKNTTCNNITASTLTLVAVDCAGVWPALQASSQFPDVFAPVSKQLPVCYQSNGPAAASIGQHAVTIASTLSGWTSDFVPVLFHGPDNLGTVVTQLSIVDPSGNYTGKLFTRDTIDLSQIFVIGTADEQDVIVGGSGSFNDAKGTYRAASVANQDASIVTLSNLHGVVCQKGQ